MDGDIRFIAARSFWQPCVSVKGNASMFGNIHFEGCRNKDQDSPRSQTRFAWSVGILGSPSKEDWGEVSIREFSQGSQTQYNKQIII